MSKVDVVELPDGSGVMTGSLPLPKDHWVFDDSATEPPMPMRMGTLSPFRLIFAKAIREAARYATRNATRYGTDADIDPDCIVQQMVVGLLGYHTSDGSAQDVLSPPPAELPLLFANGITLPKGQVKELAEAAGFRLRPQGEGLPDDLHQYVYDFANSIAMQAVQQFIGELGQARFLADVPLPENQLKEAE